MSSIQVKVCPDCGGLCEVFDAFCPTCDRPMADVDPIDEAALNVAFQPIKPVTIKLLQLSLSADHSPTGKEMDVCPNDGDFVLGREFGTYTPEIDLKNWSVPFVSTDRSSAAFNQRQRGISKSHAVLSRKPDGIYIWRHPDAASNLPVKVNGTVLSTPSNVSGNLQVDPVLLKDGDVVELGDIFEPAAKQKAPGVIFKVQISS